MKWDKDRGEMTFGDDLVGETRLPAMHGGTAAANGRDDDAIPELDLFR